MPIRARLCPENGAIITIQQTESGRDEIRIVPECQSDALPEGLVFIALLNGDTPPVCQPDCVVEIPEGATVKILDANGVAMALLEIHRNGSKPMLNIIGDTHPNSGKPLYHHVEGEGYFGATRLPNELFPLVAIWCASQNNTLE